MRRVLICALACAGSVLAQSDMSGMKMGTPAENFLMGLASGTSVNPEVWPMPMQSASLGSWNVDLMAQAFLVETQQTGRRGGDKLYSTNWMMFAFRREAGKRGAFQTDGMLSLEPATITNRRYPLLFQTGETAYGRPIVDGQHPHNLFMAVGFTYAYQLGDQTVLELAFHPVGDPTLGPVAYPHRASAAELPEAPLSHHLQDSTHIADDVVTAGLAYRKFKFEASGFHGAEPGENRWIIQQGAVDSYSGRIWFLPSSRWAIQASAGRLTHPETAEQGDQVRTTASISYSRPLFTNSWSWSLIWGRNHYTATGQNTNSYLAESVLPIGRINFLTGRFELVDKNELFPGITPQRTARIGAYTLGYTRDVNLFKRIESGFGANLTAYSQPPFSKPEYGNHPLSANVYLRLRLRPLP